MTGTTDDEYDDLLKRQILNAYGFGDDMTPEDREIWDAYGRLADAIDAANRAGRANVMAVVRAAPAAVTEHLHAAGKLPGGLRVEWSPETLVGLR